jgi:nucleoside 2-deoxyribosyltransferase
MKNRVYLAGPAVFRQNAREIFRASTRICEALGLAALIPLDETLAAADAIFSANARLIDSADLVIADITPFRGPHCDVGTAWEIGYAVALGRPVLAYSADTRVLAQRIPGTNGRDGDGCLIEDFGLAENLMVTGALADRLVHPDLESAATAARDLLSQAGTR